MNDTTDRKPLTDCTWNDHRQGLGRSGQDPRGVSWPEASDLTYELAARTHLTVEQARALVYAATSGLPIFLQWEIALNIDGPVMEVKRTAVIVDRIYPAAEHASVPFRFRIRYCGFGHGVSAREILDATVPETETEFRRPGQGDPA